MGLGPPVWPDPPARHLLALRRPVPAPRESHLRHLERTAWAAKAARLPTITQRVHITATVHRDHNRGRWDVHNLTDTAKAAIDGLVTVGVLEDDSNRFVTGPDMRAGDPWADAALVLTIHEIGEVA